MTPNVTGIPNSGLTLSSTLNFKLLPAFDLTYRMQAKVFRQEGDLKYEYNPFRNVFSSGETEIVNGTPITSDKGMLKDFRTNQLKFNLNNPVDMTIQPSYDGTVNVILNDDLNPPRLINSRFTAKEDMTYEIIDRRGNNDTNVYKEEYLDQTTRLFKTTERIPYITFEGLFEGGSAEVGNYVFYLKYVDADGNESDIIAESGIISCHIGKINDPFSMRGGIADENSNKLIKFSLHNLDDSYDYVNVYFSRTTGDANNQIVKYYKINNKKLLSSTEDLEIIYTGLDGITEISIDELNIAYNIVDKVKTQAQVQNMLFLGNVDKPTVPYKDLEDLSLRIYPTVSNRHTIGAIDHNYAPISLSNELDNYEYYNTHNIYSYTGYWDKEIYRLGIVYILKDDSVSPVFSVRGRNNLSEISSATLPFKNKIGQLYAYKNLYDDQGKRVYMEVNEDGYILDGKSDLENGRGVIRINYNGSGVIKEDGIHPLGIDFNIEKDTLAEIKKFAKGFFFVRQKRIPTTLVQGITVGVDNVSNVPTLRAEFTDATGNVQTNYFTESFFDNTNELTHDFTSRLITSANTKVSGILSPEAIIQSSFYNNFFTGATHNISPSIFVPVNNYFKQDPANNRHFFIENYTTSNSKNAITKDVKMTLIEDDKPLRFSGTKRFSTRAGIPEEAWRVAFFGYEDKSAQSKTLIRGSYTGFVGMEGYNVPTNIVNVHIPGYDPNNMKDYFNVRFDSSDAFYSISKRYDFRLLDDAESSDYSNLTKNPEFYRFNEYRGDCYVNTVTVRMQRNFQDPDVPISDTIIDSFTWKDNYKGFSQTGAINSESLNKINRNDVNAIEIGHWVTFKVCSNINLALRDTDTSVSTEYGLTGSYRSFFPLSSMSTKGESKIPESTVFNKGFATTVSNKIYYHLPDVPYIKNIFDTRIMYSDMHITDAFRNGYRVFQGMSYKDVTRQFGGVVKLFNANDNLLCIFERGIGIFPINREGLIAGNETGDIFTKGLGVLPEKPQMISDRFGSSWIESIVRTDNWIYGVDTIGKKIWRTTGQPGSFESISDFRMQFFLNNNIVLSEDDKKPTVALKNVKTHYDTFKKDVYFTFYDVLRDGEEIEWSLVYNELDQTFKTFTSWTPLASANISNVWFTFDRQSGKNIALPGFTNNKSDEAVGITLVGKTETFNKVDGTATITRTEDLAINIVSHTAHKIATIEMKGYTYYDKYEKRFSFLNGYDEAYFEIKNDNELWWKGIAATADFPKYSFFLRMKVELYSLLNGQEVKHSEWQDLLGIKVARNYIWSTKDLADLEAYDNTFSTWFWKHGQAGLFDIATDIQPTTFYDRQEPFELEFVVVDDPNSHKIFNNLHILSNNIQPDSFQFTVTKDVYELDNMDGNSNFDDSIITEINDKFVTTYQKSKNLRVVGRRLGNIDYLEDFWKVEIRPLEFKKDNVNKQSRLRDKYMRVRIRYTGDKLVLINAVKTMFTKSYA